MTVSRECGEVFRIVGIDPAWPDCMMLRCERPRGHDGEHSHYTRQGEYWLLMTWGRVDDVPF